MVREKFEPAAPTLPKNTMTILIVVIVLAALAYLGASLWAGFGNVVKAVRDVGVLGVLGVFVASLCSYLLGFVRWAGYLKLLGFTVPRLQNLNIYFGSFALAMTPARSGELLRGVFLQKYDVPFPASFASFAAERIIDLLAMALLVMIGLWSYVPARPMILLVVLSILAVVIILNLPKFLRTLRAFAETKLPQRLSGVATGLVDTALNFRSLFGLRGSGYGLSLGLLIVAAEGLGLYILLQSLGSDIGLFTALAIYGFSLLAGALSFLPGGVGGFEAAMILLLTVNGLSEAQAVAMTLLIRLGTLWFAVLIGISVLPRVARG
ncbi:MAG: lysylphosphatidylglycerol synthase transmembrane domain-containing protein [Trueperaceae bacterium]